MNNERPDETQSNPPTELVSQQPAEPLEGLRMDPKDVISADQIISVLDAIQEEIKLSREPNPYPLAEKVAERLVSEAYRSIDATIAATALTTLSHRGNTQPTPEEFDAEVTETIIRTEDFIQTIRSASAYVSGEVQYHNTRQALLKFFDIEISLLESLDNAANIDPAKIKEHIALLKGVKSYYEKEMDIKREEASEETDLGSDSIQRIPKVKGRPVKEKIERKSRRKRNIPDDEDME